MCLVTSCWEGSSVIRCSFIKRMKTANVKKASILRLSNICMQYRCTDDFRIDVGQTAVPLQRKGELIQIWGSIFEVRIVDLKTAFDLTKPNMSQVSLKLVFQMKRRQ